MTKLPMPVQADPMEIQRFNLLAQEWWDMDGPMAPLHRMNPARMGYIVDTLEQHFPRIKGLNILDVGCGGGLVSEPLSRLGAKMTGIDGAADLIAVAKTHAAMEQLDIRYENRLTEALVAEGHQFDAVLALEIIEHVPDPQAFIADLAALVKPGGIVVLSTLNRSLASLAFGVVTAEYILRWLPRGTHQWRRFIKPSELYVLCRDQGLNPVQTMGLHYNPLTENFSLDEQRLGINYFLTATRP